MKRIHHYVIDFAGELNNFKFVFFSLILFFREVLCEDALRSTIGDNLLWSASRDTQEGAQGNSFFNYLF
jgi:hypothetical protein